MSDEIESHVYFLKASCNWLANWLNERNHLSQTTHCKGTVVMFCPGSSSCEDVGQIRFQPIHIIWPFLEFPYGIFQHTFFILFYHTVLGDKAFEEVFEIFQHNLEIRTISSILHDHRHAEKSMLRLATHFLHTISKIGINGFSVFLPVD